MCFELKGEMEMKERKKWHKGRKYSSGSMRLNAGSGLDEVMV